VPGSPYCVAMDPARKRKTRLVVALTCALLLAGALVYTSFSAASEARQPSELADAVPGQTYQLTGRVAKGSWEHQGTTHTFRVEDRKGGASVLVRYVGQVPDPFREGREIVIDVRKQGATFEGQPDSLVTKCPSKFTAEPKT
jgi:cytochrome c-type biogenesis protein CcmE